jgi:CBS domain-containing protein
MGHTVEKVMTRTVAVVGPRAPFKTIVEVMEENRVSAVPVVDDEGTLVGIVTEEDLLLKEGRFQDDVRLLETPRRRRERRKAEGLVATDLMTAPVVTVAPVATLAAAARRMHERHVKRLPVVDTDGKLVGIVSRSDLLRVFVRPDPFLEQEVNENVIRRHFPDQAQTITATVHDGVLHLTGTIERSSQIELLLGLLEGVDGLVGIEDELVARIDDVQPPSYAASAVGALGYAYVPVRIPGTGRHQDAGTG